MSKGVLIDAADETLAYLLERESWLKNCYKSGGMLSPDPADLPKESVREDASIPGVPEARGGPSAESYGRFLRSCSPQEERGEE